MIPAKIASTDANFMITIYSKIENTTALGDG